MFGYEPLHILLAGIAMLAILLLEGPRKLATIAVLIISIVAAVKVFSPPVPVAPVTSINGAQRQDAIGETKQQQEYPQ